MRILAVLFGLFILIHPGWASSSATIMRLPAVAGSFYPATAPLLAREIEGQLAQAPAVDIDGRILAVIVPHAGIIYSGGTAACAFRLLEELAREECRPLRAIAPVRVSTASPYTVPRSSGKRRSGKCPATTRCASGCWTSTLMQP